MITLLKVKFGSKVYGTDNENSDDDIKFVYLQTPEDRFLNGHRPYIQVDKDTYGYELETFSLLLSKSDPACLEILFTPAQFVIEKHKLWNDMVTEGMLTKYATLSFSNFATSQLQKAKNIKHRFFMEENEVPRKSLFDFCNVLWGMSEAKTDVPKQGTIPVLEFLALKNISQDRVVVNKIDKCKEVFALYISETPTKGICEDTSCSLRLSSSPKNTYPFAYMIYNEDAYRSHCKKYKEYTDWLKNRNEQRYKTIVDTDSKIDVKSAYHMVRLLNMAKEIVTEGKLIVDRRGIDADFLKTIRKGQVSQTEIFDYSEKMSAEINELFKTCTLPNSNNQKVLDSVAKIKCSYMEL